MFFLIPICFFDSQIKFLFWSLYVFLIPKLCFFDPYMFFLIPICFFIPKLCFFWSWTRLRAWNDGYLKQLPVPFFSISHCAMIAMCQGQRSQAAAREPGDVPVKRAAVAAVKTRLNIIQFKSDIRISIGTCWNPAIFKLNGTRHHQTTRVGQPWKWSAGWWWTHSKAIVSTGRKLGDSSHPTSEVMPPQLDG